MVYAKLDLTIITTTETIPIKVQMGLTSKKYFMLVQYILKVSMNTLEITIKLFVRVYA
jgi:hypothetical protein